LLFELFTSMVITSSMT